MQWIHHRGTTNFEEMSDISLGLRGLLSQVAEVKPPKVVSERYSADRSRKWLIEILGGGIVESVLIPNGDKATLCISSQVGCTLSCSFCHTGTMPLVRNLTVDEIILQVLSAKDSLLDWNSKNENRKITNIVFMGMGEPLYNYETVLKASKILLDNEGLCYSRRKITLSTSGVVPVIEKLKTELEVSLAISLHAVNDKLRNILVPINKKWPIDQIITTIKKYPKTAPNLEDRRSDRKK